MAKAQDPPPHIDGRNIFLTATSPEALFDGWARVSANRGAAGGDGVSCETFGIETHRRIAVLSQDLRNGKYQPGPVRNVDIPKTSGGLRKLTIPCVRDRVAQSSVAILLTPLLDREFEEGSFGYRPGRSVKQAVELVRRLRTDGFEWTVDADIERYFDSIPHDRLMERVRQSISDSPLTELIALWLETGSPDGRGVAQGSPLSPLLSNLYLDDLDEALADQGIRVVRFADDFVLLTRDRGTAEKALQLTSRLLAGQGLALNAEKTRVRGFDETLRFLGHLFVRSWLMPDPDRSTETQAEDLLRRVAETDRREDAEAQQRSREREDDEAAGYDRGLRVLYLAEPGRQLRLQNQSFAVHEAPSDADEDEGRRLAAVHHTRVDRIDLGPHADVDVVTLRHALSSETPVAFMNGHGETLGLLAPSLSPHAERHLAQARHRLDDQLRLDLARRFVDGRLRNQRALLRRLNHRRGSETVVSVLTGLNRSIAKSAHAKSIKQLLGYEGDATKSFWRAWSSLLLHGYSLTSRHRRGARDAVNIVLNLTASLLARDIGAMLGRRGLHPGFGVLHGAANGDDGCVYDLMEEFRAPMVEGLALYLLNNRVVNAEHFEDVPGSGMRLKTAGLTAAIRGYEERASSLVKSRRSGHRVTWRRIMLEQAEALAAHVEGRESYQPYVMDY